MALHSTTNKEPSTRNLMETMGRKHEGKLMCICYIHLAFSMKTETETQRRTKMYTLYITQLEKRHISGQGDDVENAKKNQTHTIYCPVCLTVYLSFC